MPYKDQLSQMTDVELINEAIVLASRLKRWRKDSPEFEEAAFQLSIFEKFMEVRNV